MKKTVSAGFAGAVAAVGLAVMPTPSAAVEGDPAPTCHGQAATVVGTPGQPLDGTDGNDVIVTNGARPVHAGPGNDLICVTGRVGHVSAGYGDDLVDATERVGRGRTTLSKGSDTFLGGPAFDEVEAGGRDEPIVADGAWWDDERDVIRTGRGGADVRSGTDYTTTTGPNDDVVVLGNAGGKRNTVDYGGEMGDDGRLSFGAGRTTLRTFEHDDLDSWVLDNVRGAIAADGVETLHWSGRVQRFVIGHDFGMQKRTFTFLGTNGDEELRLWSTNTRRGLRVLARMGGGDDRVNVLETASARVRGGSGDDRMVGSHGNDRLLGGGGRDVADGRSGADTCQAEVIVACER